MPPRKGVSLRAEVSELGREAASNGLTLPCSV